MGFPSATQPQVPALHLGFFFLSFDCVHLCAHSALQLWAVHTKGS